MENTQVHEFPCFLSRENDLESVQEEYFNPRLAEEEVNEDEEFSDDSSDDEAGFDIDFEFSDLDSSERSKVEAFIRKTCGCTLGDEEKPCSSTLQLEDVIDCRNNCAELESSELDLVILGIIQSAINCDEVSSSGRKERKRQRSRVALSFHGHRICLKTFLFMHRLHKTRFYSLVKHYRKNGLTLRTHGNTKRLPSSAFSVETVEHVVKFIMNVAEDQALLLPGRVPGFKRIDVKLLPSSLTKCKLWKMYHDASTAAGHVAVGYSKFCDLWKQLCPFIVIMRPASDLCWTCQKNNNQILKSANLPETRKAEAVKQQETHLKLAAEERDFYKSCCKTTKDALADHLKDVDFSEKRIACSLEGTVHYSYNYAQQLHYPADPYQPGPIYFKTPRKCGLFGVCCETIPRQVNFLIDEVVLTGKGANSTISYVHYFFERHGLGETFAQIHADNCGAQNKNNAFMWYYLWRVMTGLHHTIDYSFLLAGHTKFAPDWCFGLMKQRTRRTFISSLFDIARAVEDSATVNTAELVGLHNGRVLIPAYDWMSYLDTFFKRIPQLKTYHHFRFDKDFPGTVFCKQYWSTEERALNILKSERNVPEVGRLPPVINPIGLSRERAEYLFKEIREFCRPGTEDLVAPEVV